MNDRPFRTVARRGAVTLGAVATLFMAGSTSAIAVTSTTDTVSDVHIETACGTHDDMSIVLYFHVDAADGTSTDGRVTEASATMLGAEAGDGPYNYTMTPPGGAAFFATGDYTFDISRVFDRTTIDGDSVDASVLLGSGAVAGHDAATVSCFTGTDATTVQNFEFTARAGCRSRCDCLST